MKQVVLAVLMSGSAVLFGQNGSVDINSPEQPTAPKLKESRPATTDASQEITLPSGTKIPLALKHAITTKSAHEGDAVYAETTFPVVVNNQIIIPAGSYVQGSVSNVKRPGRVKGRAEILVHFNTLIFPNGYTLLLPGAVDNVPGLEGGRMKSKDKEGTIQGDSTKGKDAARIAETAGTGGLIGAAADGGKGAAMGGAAGGVIGLATVLFSRGPDLRLDAGSTMETVLERPITVDMARVKLKP
jgi:type IV secretion system protein VirB10